MYSKTRKALGGNLSNTKGLNLILSIGYELECANLMKLTESDDHVLFNSDTNLTNMDYGDEGEESESAIEKTQELVDVSVIDNNGNVDSSASFSITNDIAEYQFSRKLMKSCYYPSLDIRKSSKRSSGRSNVDTSKEKNELYIFRDTATNEDYKIKFIFNTPRECNEHSNVEWIFTYYKPNRRRNVVVNTFLNMIKNIVSHVNDLIPITGNYIFKYKDSNDSPKELIIDKPTERILYHKPNTNLYYLQNQVSDRLFNIDDTCIKIQMTFAAKIENVFTVLKTLFTDEKKSIETIYQKTEVRLKHITKIHDCVSEMLKSYMATNQPTAIKKTDVEILKNYLFLIMYRIDRYYYFKKREGKQAKYFKDTLAVNCRHNNYSLYIELKNNIERIFQVDDRDAANIIKKIILQPTIMNNMVDSEIIDKLRKGVFLESNVLEKTNSHYGDPIYSLCSYFDFIEDPIANENSSNGSEEQTDYDWFEYQDIEGVSARMPLKDNIILIECRNFQELISSYVYGIGDSELKTQMKKGACNIMTKHFSEDVPGLTIANFKKVIEILKIKKSSKTQKRTKSKSK
jgi:hypothetical protein